MALLCPVCDAALPMDGDTLDHESAKISFHCHECGRQVHLVSGDECDDGTHDKIPSQLHQHYASFRKIGEGAFGVVYKAHDERLDREVAIKVPRHDRVDPDMFVREAQATAQIKHPGVVTVHDVGIEDDAVFIVTDLVEGENLEDWLEGRRHDAHTLARMCRDIAQALHHAHEAGVTHRDLKPENIMVDKGDQPRVMDFGLALRELPGVTMTMDGKLVGTPQYMSPEQAAGRGHEADRRSDVYSLGVVLFRMLTGEVPFTGTVYALLAKIETEEPPRPRSLDPRLPADLETICLKCLEKSPGRRYPSAADLADDLTNWLEGRPIRARQVRGYERAWRWARRNPGSSSLLALLFVSLVLGTAVSVSYAIEADRNATQAKAGRDRAEEAEHRERVDAARDLAREGAWSDALERYDAAIKDNREDRHELKIERLRVLFALGRRDDLRSALDEPGWRSPIPGQVSLYQGLFLLSDSHDAEPVNMRLRDALADGSLSASDRHFAQGLLATDPGEAARHFEQAINGERYFERAYAYLALVHVYSGRLDGARDVVAKMQIRFPEDETADFLDAWLDAWTGDVELATRKLRRLRNVDKSEVELLIGFCQTQHAIIAGIGRLDAFGGTAWDQLEVFIEIGKLVVLIKTLKPEFRDYLSGALLGRFGLSLPNLPVYQHGLLAVIDSLPKFVLGRKKEAIDGLQDAVDEHDDALLSYMLAFFKITHAKRHFVSGDYESGMLEMRTAIDDFQMSAQQSSLARDIPRWARVWATLLQGFYLQFQPPPRDQELQDLFPANIRELLNRGDLRTNELHKLLSLLTTYDNLPPDDVRPLIGEWQAREPRNPDATLQRARLEFRAENWAFAWRLATEVLRSDSGNKNASTVQSAAAEKMREY